VTPTLLGDILLIACGLALALVISAYCRHVVVRERADRLDAEARLARAEQERDTWRAKAERYEASLDGAGDYVPASVGEEPIPAPRWPRPLGERKG